MTMRPLSTLCKNTNFSESRFQRISPKILKISCLAQKEKGFIPSPLPLTPKRIKRRFFFSAIKGRASLFPLLASAPRMHCYIFVSALPHHEAGEFLGAAHTLILRHRIYCTDSVKVSESKAITESKRALDSEPHTQSNSKIFDEKCGLQGKHEGSYLSGNDPKCFSPLPHLPSGISSLWSSMSQKAELPRAKANARHQRETKRITQ